MLSFKQFLLALLHLKIIFNYFRRYLSWQLSGLAYHLDPLALPNKLAIVPEEIVQNDSSPSKWNLYFIFPFFIILLFTIHGTVYLPYSVGVPLTWASLSISLALLFRQMFPPIMWPQTDFIVGIALLGTLAIYASFWRHPWTLPRYVAVWTFESNPILCIGNTFLSPGSSLKILKVHRRIRKAFLAGVIVACLLADIFLIGNTFINGFYSPTNGHFLLSLLLFFLSSIFVIYGKKGHSATQTNI